MPMNKIYTFIFLFGVLFWGRGQSFKTYMYQGNQEYMAGQYDKALEKYQNSVTSNPNSYNAHLGLGNAYYKSGKLKEAQKEFNIAKTLSKNSKKIASAQFNDANASLKEGKTDEALQKYRKALAKDPTNPGLQRNYALALKKQEKQNNSSKDSSQKPNPQQKQDKGKEGKEGNKPENQPNGKSQESGGNNGNKQGSSGNNQAKPNTTPQIPKPKNFSEEQKKDILNGIKNRESNTAGKILNKNAYYEPESKEKDW